MTTEFEHPKWEALKALANPLRIRQKLPPNFDPAHYIEEPELRTSFLKIGMLFFCIFVFAAGAFIYIKGTPLHSLYMFKTAVADRDVDGAMKYLDIDSVVDSLSRMSVSSREAPSNRNEYGQMGRSSSKVSRQSMFTVKENMKAEIKELIANPRKGGKENIFLLASDRAWWDWSIEQSGNIAIASISDPKPARFKMRKEREGHWRIVEFASN